MTSGSNDSSIIIYNKISYKPDLIIKEHNDNVNYLLELSSGILASCSDDNTIILFNINGNYYNILQILDYHRQRYIIKIIELKNKQFFHVHMIMINLLLFFLKRIMNIKWIMQ